ncbi:MAG: nitronate monooxygenase [Ktedonobacterales bacterium]|nr:nitronate monooxygenase [Ktedonobacterales bacterium]
MRTRVSDLLGIDYPIVQGGLAYLSLAPLAAAVSNAGGLGQIGVAGLATPADLRSEIAHYRTLSQHPFGVNFPIGIKPMEEFLEVALEADAPVVSFTGGNPEALLRRTQAAGAGTRTLVLVAGVRAARKAEDLGADAVIAVGFEGGGHLGRDDLGTLVLVPRIAEAVKIPVLASGGIADGRGFAAALALGATGVELGTRFVAVTEGNAHPAYKAAIVAAEETDTVIIERSIGRPARVLRSPFVEQLLAIEADLARRGATREEALPEMLPFILGENNTRAAIDGDLEHGFVWGGQVVGLIHDIPTTADLIWHMVRTARSISHTMSAL